jgi:hypothetical protein
MENDGRACGGSGLHDVAAVAVVPPQGLVAPIASVILALCLSVTRT